jgi:hypothetical protein
VRITAGVLADHPYIGYDPKNPAASPGITVAPDPPIGGGFTQADLDKAEAKGKIKGAAERDTAWENHIVEELHP